VKYPVASKIILTHLKGLHAASVPLTLTTIRGLMICQLQHLAPEIFEDWAPDGTQFHCSESFVRKYLQHTVGWSICRSTWAGCKIPDKVDEIFNDAFLRVAYSIKNHDVPSSLLVNSDQGQLMYAQGSTVTYAPTGTKQVTTLGAEDKQAITMFLSVTNDRTLLPIQVIYKGLSLISTPSEDSPSYAEAMAAGFLFEYSKTKTYWSTQETMCNFVNRILAPYLKSQKEKLGLLPDQCSIWLIDCWLVHRSKEFLNWMWTTHPTIIIIFVPAGCTGLFQPCNVGVQLPVKHTLKRSAHEDVVNKVLRQLEAGVTAQMVTIESGIKVLRNRIVCWLWKAYTAVNKPDIIKKVSKF
jgi:hypothetical protein